MRNRSKSSKVSHIYIIYTYVCVFLDARRSKEGFYSGYDFLFTIFRFSTLLVSFFIMNGVEAAALLFFFFSIIFLFFLMIINRA